MADLPPLTEDYSYVNRSLLIISHKKPFYDWLISHDPTDDKLEPLEADAYLIPPFETPVELENYLRQNFDRFFQIELNDWYLDEELWPQKRTWKMFGEWFNYQIISMVRDACDALPLETDNPRDLFGEGGMYDDEGNLVDLSTVPVPARCMLCSSFGSNDPEENILCNLNRFDQRNEDTFECESFDPVNRN